MTTAYLPATGSVAAASPDGTAVPAVLRRVLTASFIGNFVEWFDYASYGYFATVIAVVFFPEIAPAAALLLRLLSVLERSHLSWFEESIFAD